jgi:hypothetical protein
LKELSLELNVLIVWGFFGVCFALVLFCFVFILCRAPYVGWVFTGLAIPDCPIGLIFSNVYLGYPSQKRDDKGHM